MTVSTSGEYFHLWLTDWKSLLRLVWQKQQFLWAFSERSRRVLRLCLASKAFNKLKSFCSMQRISSVLMPKGQLWNTAGQTHSMEEKCCWSSWKRPHWARMPCQYLMRFQLHHSSKWACRTWLEVFIKYLTAFQNCLLPKLDILFDGLSSCTTSSLNSTYLDHKEELARFSSFFAGAVSLPNFSFNRPVHPTEIFCKNWLI